jgi:large subunit ribosomal protein L22
MEVQAQAKWVRTSPRKVRLVARTLRNMPVADALIACSFMPKAAARDVAKVIRSAQANAENNFNLAKDDLVLKELRVEPGPMLKRGQPRAMGRLFSIFKRTTHITAIVEDRPGAVRRRAAALPRAPQPTSRPAQGPTARDSARAATKREQGPTVRDSARAATTESDEVEAPLKPKKAKAATKPEASKPASTGKKTEATKTDAKKTQPKKTESKKPDKKDKEKKSK